MNKFLYKTATALFLCATLFSCSDDSDVSMTCPDGYTGTNCLTKKIPTKIKITKIDITSFPTHKDNMSNWDSGEDATGNAPDVFLALRSDSQLLLTSGILTDAASSDLPLTVTPTTPIVISNISEQLTIGIFDSDGNLPEEMAVSQFYSYRSTDIGFPTTIMINDFSQGFAAMVYVTYEW